ncbi:MFS transporter [Pseudomonas aeruginosa]
MDALLILGGLLLMVAGYIWVIVLAFGTGLLWGYGSLFPPVALAYIGVHWRTARKGVGLAALGCIPLVVGLALLASHDAARLEAILSLRWLKPEARPPAELSIALSGEFNGKPFAPQSGELIGGVLSLRQGHDFYAQRELQIRLPAQPLGALRLDVLPEDGGALPEVELSWLQPDQDLPEARRLLRGYTLHLDLRPKAPNRLEGEFHLSLPSDYRTTLSGHVELYTDRLRYRHGKVDLGYDSDDTLALVLRDYLQRRFASRDVSLVRAPSWRAASHTRPLRIEALVAGQAQVLELTLEKNARREWTVRGDAFPALPAEPATVAAAAAPPEPQALPAPGNATLDLELVQVEPQRYSQRLVKATTVRGRIAEGRFTGLDSEGRLVIRREMPGAGEASYLLRPAEIARLELLER